MVTVRQQWVVSSPGFTDWVVDEPAIVSLQGQRFTEVGKKSKACLKWVSKYSSWSHAFSTVVDEVISLRSDACAHTVCSAPMAEGATAYRQYKMKKVIVDLVASRANELIEFSLPEITCNGVKVGPVTTSCPFSIKGPLLLKLDRDTMHWFWCRCQEPTDACKRSVPNSAEFPPHNKEIYWHKQKNAFMGHRRGDQSDVIGNRFKLFRLGETRDPTDVEQTIDKAKDWTGSPAPKRSRHEDDDALYVLAAIDDASPGFARSSTDSPELSDTEGGDAPDVTGDGATDVIND